MIIRREVGVGLEKGYNQAISEVIVIVGQGQDQEQAWTDRIRCYKCREYNHFAKDCTTMNREGRETEQIQQMFNLDEEQIALKKLAIDTYDSLNCLSSLEEVQSEHLNL